MSITNAEEGILTLARTLTGQELLEVIKLQIHLLPREERAHLRPWVLARYDVRGYPERRADGSST